MSDTPIWEDADFEFEEPDYSVGLNGGWLHHCNDDGTEVSVDIAEGWAFDHFEGEGGNRYAVGTKSVLCNECGSSSEWTERDWDPEVNEDTAPDLFTF